MFGQAQTLLVMVLSFAAFGAGVWGLVDAARYQAGTYVAAGKQSKALWVVLLAVASMVAFISLPFPFGRGGGIISFLGIAAVAVIVLYFATVRPVLRQHEPRRGGPRGGTTGGW